MSTAGAGKDLHNDKMRRANEVLDRTAAATLEQLRSIQRTISPDDIEAYNDIELHCRQLELRVHRVEQGRPGALPPADTFAIVKAMDRERAWKTKRIVRPPGYLAWHVLQFVYPAKTFTRVFKPHIADMRDDHAAALNAGAVRQARWIVIRGNLMIAAMVAIHIPTWMISLVRKVWPTITL